MNIYVLISPSSVPATPLKFMLRLLKVHVNAYSYLKAL